MKLKEFGPPGGGRPKFYYVDPPLMMALDAQCTNRNDREQCFFLENEQYFAVLT